MKILPVTDKLLQAAQELDFAEADARYRELRRLLGRIDHAREEQQALDGTYKAASGGAGAQAKAVEDLVTRVFSEESVAAAKDKLQAEMRRELAEQPAIDREAAAHRVAERLMQDPEIFGDLRRERVADWRGFFGVRSDELARRQVASLGTEFKEWHRSTAVAERTCEKIVPASIREEWETKRAEVVAEMSALRQIHGTAVARGHRPAAEAKRSVGGIDR